MRACHFVIILAVTLSAVNGTALQARSKIPCSDCDDQPPRFEVGVSASGMHLPDNNNFGLDARAVFNFNSFFSLEGEGDFFLNNAPAKIFSGGRAVKGVFGPKFGIRILDAGFFAKVQPGVISFSNTLQGIALNSTVPLSFSIQTGRLTEPALDLGGVFEFYPSRHWAWRTDIGDTAIFYRPSSFFGVRVPAVSKSNFQFSMGIQYRF